MINTFTWVTVLGKHVTHIQITPKKISVQYCEGKKRLSTFTPEFNGKIKAALIFAKT